MISRVCLQLILIDSTLVGWQFPRLLVRDKTEGGEKQHLRQTVEQPDGD